MMDYPLRPKAKIPAPLAVWMEDLGTSLETGSFFFFSPVPDMRTLYLLGFPVYSRTELEGPSSFGFLPGFPTDSVAARVGLGS